MLELCRPIQMPNSQVMVYLELSGFCCCHMTSSKLLSCICCLQDETKQDEAPSSPAVTTCLPTSEWHNLHSGKYPIILYMWYESVGIGEGYEEGPGEK